jgi:hypothetical protein
MWQTPLAPEKCSTREVGKMRGKSARECRKLLVSSRNPPLEMPSWGSRGHDALAPVMGRIAACGKKPAPPGDAGTRSIPAYQDHSRTTPGCPDRMHALDHDVISGVTRPTVRAAFPLPLRRQRLAQFDASGAPAPRGSAIRPETAQTRQHPHPGRRTASPDRQCPS